jgi:hypothetical protein
VLKVALRLAILSQFSENYKLNNKTALDSDIIIE